MTTQMKFRRKNVLSTVNQVCEEYQISRTKFYDLVRQGLIKPVKIGKATRVVTTEMDELIEKLRVNC